MTGLIVLTCKKCGRTYGVEPHERSVFTRCLSCNGYLK